MPPVPAPAGPEEVEDEVPQSLGVLLPLMRSKGRGVKLPLPTLKASEAAEEENPAVEEEEGEGGLEDTWPPVLLLSASTFMAAKKGGKGGGVGGVLCESSGARIQCLRCLGQRGGGTNAQKK